MDSYYWIHKWISTRVSIGLQEEWSPQNKSFFFLPSYLLYRLSVWAELMSLSFLPAMKRMLLPFLLAIRSMISSSLMLIQVFCLISLSTMPRRHGKRHETIGLQRQGTRSSIFYRQSLLKLENGESATTIWHFELKSKLTEPMLLPHPTTLYPFPIKYQAAISTSLASSFPKEINSRCNRFPQPSKSKHASPTFPGRLSNYIYPQSLLEEFPCRQRIRQSISLGVQTDSGKGM